MTKSGLCRCGCGELAEPRLPGKRGRNSWYAGDACRRRAAKARQSEEQRAHYRKKGFEFRLKKKYGISPAEYASMYKSQRGRCAVCRRAKATDIEHCHKSGRVRGLVCNPCNRLLAALEHSGQYLEAAFRFLG